ncbi:MAG TPA: hypothetical protein DDW50_13670 [Firmicutes bacterium]|nr:hypothetical protein [Bacillota bacterium]
MGQEKSGVDRFTLILIQEKSVLPEKCIITLDRHLFPGETEESVLMSIRILLDRLAQRNPDFRAETKLLEASK